MKRLILLAAILCFLGCQPPRSQQKFDVAPVENNVYVFTLKPPNYRPDTELFTETLNNWLKENPDIMVIRIECVDRLSESNNSSTFCSKYFVFTKTAAKGDK